MTKGEHVKVIVSDFPTRAYSLLLCDLSCITI